MLSPNADNSIWINAIYAQIETAVEEFASQDASPAPDYEFKQNIRAAAFKENGLFSGLGFATKTFLFHAGQDLRAPQPKGPLAYQNH